MKYGLEIILSIIAISVQFITLLSIMVKPLREKLFGIRKFNRERIETDRCLLRNGILHVYYKYADIGKIPQYDYENLGHMYKQYKKLGGNSFVDRVWSEAQGWEIIISKPIKG